MQTIVIDESGNFEKKSSSELKFVGGYIYNGDIEEEEKTIQLFLKDFCSKNNLIYPKDIHSTKMNIETRIRFKQEVIKFIAHANKKDKNSYQIVCMLNPGTVRKDYNYLSNIIDDNFASNLYEHMITNLLINNIFTIQYYKKVKEIKLEIASRVFVVDIKDINLNNNYKDLGYNCFYKFDKEKKTDVNIYSLTNSTTFKSSISTMMMNRKVKEKINFSINVESINYNYYQKETTPLMYLADLVCDVLKDYIEIDNKNYKTTDLRKDTFSSPLLWIYDAADGIYNEVIESYHKNDYISVLKLLYDAYNDSSEYSFHYKKNIYPDIQNNLIKIFDIKQLKIYLEEIEFLLSKKQADYEKAFFIIDNLNSLLGDSNVLHLLGEALNEIKYKISDMYLRCYNHRGDIDNSEKHYKICEQLRGSVSLENYLQTINRKVEIDANSFNFESAIDILSNSLTILEIWRITYRDTAELMGLGNQYKACMLNIGKTLSSIGQFYAFLKQKDMALEYFLKAIDEFDTNIEQKETTISFILHLALDTNDELLYRKYEEEFFGVTDTIEQFNTLLNQQGGNKDYKFFIFVKALARFYFHRVSKPFFSELTIKRYDEYNFRTSSHPWELIYKYLTLISLKKKSENDADRFIKMALSKLTYANVTIKLINLATELEYMLLTKEPIKKMILLFKENKDIIQNNNIVNYFKMNGVSFVDLASVEDEKTYLDNVNKYITCFTFMYR